MLAPKKNPARILLCNPAAAEQGVRSGQAAKTALALVPDLELIERDTAAEMRVMRELALWANRFTPAVHIDASNALLLDVQGSLKLFGGFEKLHAALVDSLDERGYRAVIACAPTALASLWLARSGGGLFAHDRAALPGRMGRLSIDCLGWPAKVRHRLAGMGVTTIADCIRLPRDGLARRIGPDRLAELDQGFGAQPELREFYRPPRQFKRMLELPAETADSGLLLVAVQKLLGYLQTWLRRHQGAVQLLWISLHHQNRAARLERIGLLRASTDTSYLLELTRIRFDDLQFEAPVIAVTLQGDLRDPPPVAGRDLLGDQTEQGVDACALIDQLRVRLGAESVHGIRSVAEHRPEAAWKSVAVASQPSGRHEAADSTSAGFRYDPVQRRPVWMLEEPQTLHEAGGHPVFGGELELESHPERIETGWWDGRDVRRDYYVAHDCRGMRLWIFRDCRESRWYLHGFFG